MTFTLRLVLIIVSFLTFWFVMRKIRKSQILIEDAFYWVFFGVLLFILSVFPRIASCMATLLGFAAASNFVFVLVIFLLLFKLFTLSIKVSNMEAKLHNLVEVYGVDHRSNGNDNEK